MDPSIVQLLGIGISLGGGAVVKGMSKSRSKVVHKWLAPLAAVGLGIGYQAATGQALDLETITAGTQVGGTAVLLHSVYRGFGAQFKTTF